jgi:hypothetical protein
MDDRWSEARHAGLTPSTRRRTRGKIKQAIDQVSMNNAVRIVTTAETPTAVVAGEINGHRLEDQDPAFFETEVYWLLEPNSNASSSR